MRLPLKPRPWKPFVLLPLLEWEAINVRAPGSETTATPLVIHAVPAGLARFVINCARLFFTLPGKERVLANQRGCLVGSSGVIG